MKNNPEQFCYWLHGFFELSESDTLSDKQVKIIKDHLDLVFDKVTPNTPLADKFKGFQNSVESFDYHGLDTTFTGLTTGYLC